jgi:hypothetical protein
VRKPADSTLVSDFTATTTQPSPAPLLRVQTVRPGVVLLKRLPVLPATPLHHQSRLNLTLNEQGPPSAGDSTHQEAGNLR